MSRLFIIEAGDGMRTGASWPDHLQVRSAPDVGAGLALMNDFDPQVVILDPDSPSDSVVDFQALRAIRQAHPTAKVIVVTGSQDRERALEAVALGVHDYLHKPVDPDLLGTVVARALYLFGLETDRRRRRRSEMKTPLPDVLVGSPEMLRVCEVAARVASTNATITLLGESGTGKELLARGIHRLSTHAEGRFVAINCAAIPENLLESELFGYEKGAFTDAARQTRGRIELANDGTLFLDEIGDLPHGLQAKLLRFLQERVIERVGGRAEIPVNARVLCATHRDLKTMIAEGAFREDLYYRLSEITITIPPLRDRRGDVLMLAGKFLERHAGDLDRHLKGFNADALAAMDAHHWPGNIRELENRVRRAVILCEGTEITAEDLELAGAKPPGESFKLRHVRRMAEERAVRKALAYCEGNVSRAAGLLGVSRPSLYDLMRKLGVT